MIYWDRNGNFNDLSRFGWRRWPYRSSSLVMKVAAMTMPHRDRPLTAERLRRIARIRREIARGEYDSPDKLLWALRRMLEHLSDDGDSPPPADEWPSRLLD